MIRKLCVVSIASVMMVLIVSGCSRGAVESGSNGFFQVKTMELTAGEACSNGGVTIEMGFDLCNRVHG